MEVLVCRTSEGKVYSITNINYKTGQVTYVESHHPDGRPYVHKTVPLKNIETIFWLDERRIRNG